MSLWSSLKLRVVQLMFCGVGVILSAFGEFPLTYAQSPQAAREWALFNQILMIGIVVGMVVFGIMFYAIIKYREKPKK